MPVADDGLLRGDGVFEVIRLYAGARSRSATTSTASSARGAIELPVDRARRARDRACSSLRRRRRASDRAHARRAADRDHRAAPDGRAASASRPSPTRRPMILTGVKSLSYAANMQATRIAEARGADEALLVRPDGIVLEAPTSTIFWVSAEGDLRTPATRDGHPRLDHPGPRSWRASSHVEEGDCERRRPARRRRGLPRLDDARGPGRSRRSTAASCPARRRRVRGGRGAARRVSSASSVSRRN